MSNIRSILPPAILTLLTLQIFAQPVPSAQQLAWHETEFYLFFHFGPNTFTDAEWGHGTESEELFAPTNLDCEQWCRVAKAAGARGVVITAKHHDGFCLWPSDYSKHTVRESPWKAGKGDVIRELSEACKKYGLKFGVYLSPWDRNHPQYGTPEYNDVYAKTLTELLTRYGPLFEVWWDGANGEGPNGKKQVYDFPRFEKIVRKHQPNAVIFSDIGPGCRWAGNEAGTIAETNWCMLDTAGYGRGVEGPPAHILQTGLENGKAWIPAECDVSIRPGWFYHAGEDDKVKSPEQLFDIYLQSVGRGANLILNVPPDRRGRIHEKDSLVLTLFGEKLRTSFANNLARQAAVSVFHRGKKIKNNALTDGKTGTAWSFDGTSAIIELEFDTQQWMNCIKLKEEIKRNGQRIRKFQIETLTENGWSPVAQSTTVGPRKILKFKDIKTQKIRIQILDSKKSAALTEIEAYKI